MLENITQLQNFIVEISQEDERYPSEWRCLSDAPKILYALGNLRLLERRKFVIVGSRRTPSNALKLAERIAEELSSAFAIVTGAADGGDTAAIEGGMNGGVICLLAGGFSALPQANLPLLERVAKKGLLLSPHPFETPVRAFSYEYRNKLLALLGEGTLVLGAGEKSGALITAKYAKEYGKAVFAFPYPPNSAAGVGCNALIKNGGNLVENAADVAGLLGVDLTQKRKEVALTKEEIAVVELLRENGEAHANELADKTGIPVFKIRGIISSLEVKNLVVSLGGNRYTFV